MCEQGKLEYVKWEWQCTMINYVHGNLTNYNTEHILPFSWGINILKLFTDKITKKMNVTQYAIIDVHKTFMNTVFSDTYNFTIYI
jgi:hypothetical protein